MGGGKRMELKEFLEITHQLIVKVGQARKNVEQCEDCKGTKTTQEEHASKHLDEALKIRDKLPDWFVWPADNWSISRVRIKPVLKSKIDEKGHLVITTEKVEIT